jgi:subtilisin family serine protease
MKSRHVLAVVVAIVAALLVLGAAAGAGGTQRSASAATATKGAAKVDPVLLRQVARREGKVAAVVTAWHRAHLDKIKRLGIGGTKLRALPMILTRIDRAQLAKLRRSPLVRSVWANRYYRTQMEDTTWTTRARYTWPHGNKDGGLPGLGVTGEGIELAIIDTGIDGGHDDMENLIEFCETTGAVDGRRDLVLCSPFNPAAGNAGPACPADQPRVCSTDDEGHGTHVSGTMVGSGSASGGMAHPHSTIGIAPKAKLRAYSANVVIALASHQILAAYDDLTYKKQNGFNDVVAVNNSWGGGGSYDPGDPTHVAIKEAYFAGILSVFAAGNSGPEHDTLTNQCANPFTVCVAAETKPGSIVMFSSRGRPSERADTDRDGIVGDPGDEPPDNQDRKLGRAFDIGAEAPTLTAPGVNINSALAHAAGNSFAGGSCAESGTVGNPEAARGRDCYVKLSGTSMATPHVTGAIALFAEAYKKGHDNKLPPPQILMEIAERSANWFGKKSGWEREEQGAGHLDVYAGVEFAKEYPNGLKEPQHGTATPLYDPAGRHPGNPSSVVPEPDKGCTGTGSWIVGDVSIPGVEPSPIATERFGQHFIVVPERADRLRITITWLAEDANLYARLWRPGVNPDTADAPPEPAATWQHRAMADNEATGLVFVGNQRLIEVRAPEATTGVPPKTANEIVIPSGLWILRVYDRRGAVTDAVCDPESDEVPKQTQGYDYDLKVEIPVAQRSPTNTRITEPPNGDTITSRWTKIGAKADMPAQWDGVTYYEAPGTEIPGSIPEPDERKVLYFHGNGAHAGGHPLEVCTTGVGQADALAPNCGPFLHESPQLADKPAATFTAPAGVSFGGADRNAIDPNWTWYLNGVTTEIGGAMTVEWWASCPVCSAVADLFAVWRIRVFADGVLKHSKDVTAVPRLPGIAERLEATVFVPSITATQKITIHVDPLDAVTQNPSTIYYDSTQPCQPLINADGPPCDSLVRMPVGMTGVTGTGPGPQRVRVTDAHKLLRVAWDAAPDAQKYEIHRSPDPAFVPSPKTRIAVTDGYACTSPQNPTWPSHNDPGVCFDDTGGFQDRTYYYRVVKRRADGSKSLPSRVAYGMRTLYDRQVRMKVDRLYGPQFWEFATIFSDTENSWHHWWDTLELITGPHPVSARAFSQGIGSEKDSRTYVDSGADR